MKIPIKDLPEMVDYQVGEVRPTRFSSNRTCSGCGTKLNQYHKGAFCYHCDKARTVKDTSLK